MPGGLGQRAARSTWESMPSSLVSNCRAVIVTGTGNLEVHVAGAQDLGQGDGLELTIDLTGHEAHRDTRDEGRAAHAGLQEGRGRGKDGTHRRAHGLGT